MSIATVMASPDANSEGLAGSSGDALRYDHATSTSREDPNEVPGILRLWMPEHVRVLDVGCGTGALTLRATTGKHNDVIAIEPDAVRADVARSRGLKVICGLLDDSVIAEHGPFDVVVLSDVIEHVAAPSQMLELAARALKPQGVIIASVPNVAHWTVRARLLLGRFDYTPTGIMDATHLRWFTRKSLRSLFESCDLRVTDLTVAAGTWMPEYRKLPFSLMPQRLRHFIIRRLTSMFPTLFGCQIVLRATYTPQHRDAAAT